MGRAATPAYAPGARILAMSTTALQRIVYRNDPELRCRQLPPEKFFESRNAEYARNLCGRCPILAECAELAIREETHGYFEGIRGGMSPSARRAVVRARKKAAT